MIRSGRDRASQPGARLSGSPGQETGRKENAMPALLIPVLIGIPVLAAGGYIIIKVIQ